MKHQDFIENIRQEVRENGFLSATQLAALSAKRAIEFSVRVGKIEDFLKEIPCNNIKVIEYATWLTRDYRRKDLYYFVPSESVDA